MKIKDEDEFVCLTCKKIVKWPWNNCRTYSPKHEVIDIYRCDNCKIPIGIRIGDPNVGAENVLCSKCLEEIIK